MRFDRPRWRVIVTLRISGDIHAFDYYFLDSAQPFFATFAEPDSYITSIVATRLQEVA